MKATDVLPKELERSTPRQVALTTSGIGVVIAMFALVVAAIGAGTLLYQRFSRSPEPVGLTNARVVEIRRSDERLAVHYIYTVQGVERRGRTRIHKGARDRFVPGKEVPVQYILSRPEKSWLQGYGSRPMPFWLVLAVPTALLLCILPLAIVIRRQATLLREGRGTLATVTGARKISNGESSSWRVEFEWQLISGATRSGRNQVGKNPPPVGAFMPIVYDRENPKRYRLYPMSLVKVSR